jgi:hypothetical protein
MGTVNSANYNADGQQNVIKNGANKFQLGGTFSGNQKDSDIKLSPSLGAVDSSKTHITSQSTTSISGNFQYARSQQTKSDVMDDNGTLGSQVGDGNVYQSNVTYPTSFPEP